MARSATTFSNVCVINKDGNLVDIIPVRAAAVDLLGELWENGAFYVLDQADKIDPRTHQVQTIANGFAFPNGMAEERRGNIYVTDSLLGTIFRFSREDGKVKAWRSDPAPISQNPNQNVGANDLAIDADETIENKLHVNAPLALYYGDGMGFDV